MVRYWPDRDGRVPACHATDLASTARAWSRGEEELVGKEMHAEYAEYLEGLS